MGCSRWTGGQEGARVSPVFCIVACLSSNHSSMNSSGVCAWGSAVVSDSLGEGEAVGVKRGSGSPEHPASSNTAPIRAAAVRRTDIDENLPEISCRI